MLIAIASLTEGGGKSTCALNLACELAALDARCTDRWQGRRRVVLVDIDPKGTATRCCAGGRLPVSYEHLPHEDPVEIERWSQRIMVSEVDFVVVDTPPHFHNVAKEIINISDLVVVPCSGSASDLIAIGTILELIRRVRLVRLDDGPKCLLVPMRVNTSTNTEAGIETSLQKFGEPLGPVIHEGIEFADAFNAGRWIGDFAPNSAAYKEIKALTTIVVSL